MASRRQLLRSTALAGISALLGACATATTDSMPLAMVTASPLPTAPAAVAFGAPTVLLEPAATGDARAMDPTPSGSRHLYVLYTSDVQGYTDPCGCQPPRGGLARRATAIARRRESGTPVVLIDAGNTLFSGARQDLNAKSEGRLTVAAMNLMRYDALVLGPGELAAGVGRLQARLAEAEFAVLSANVRLDGELLAEPYAVLERDGIRVAVLGLTAAANTSADDRLEVADPLAAASRHVPRLRRDADVVIVAANMGRGSESALEAAVAGADLIINGGYAGPLAPVSAAVPGTVRSGGLGEYLGISDLKLDEAGRAVAYSHQSLALSFSIAEDEEMAALVRNYALAYAG